MTKLNKCKVCGGDAEINATSCSEYYGNTWQDIYIECLKNNGQDSCSNKIEITINPDIQNSCWYELIDFWNLLNK